ncbi:PREDICTED: coiled-coil domain-containing protein 166 [Nanorana parkeri]|uniref:coiled-coil domain-containing protein 166 n=1 Tax=Nanorana parkeri TaxID=125878 RepID=UPI000854E06B|nr:PREDICTED: coiled-coil domain-containing protein 166 [Nanorana parkeri]
MSPGHGPYFLRDFLYEAPPCVRPFYYTQPSLSLTGWPAYDVTRKETLVHIQPLLIRTTLCALRSMPPKKKTSQGEAAEDPGRRSPAEGEGLVVSEGERRLRGEHERLMSEHDGLRKRLEQLRRDNEFLQEEAETVRRESQEYLLYMGRRSQRRQDAIISLNDQNTRELEDLRRQKEELEAVLGGEEETLRGQLLQREAELAALRRELKEAEPMKEVQREQMSLIRRLEAEVMTSRGKHAHSLLRVKSAFLRHKVACQQDSERHLTQLSLRAHEEARSALHGVSRRVKEENRNLREELLPLINQYRGLQNQKKKLMEQKKELQREERCQSEVRSAQRRLNTSPP